MAAGPNLDEMSGINLAFCIVVLVSSKVEQSTKFTNVSTKACKFLMLHKLVPPTDHIFPWPPAPRKTESKPDRDHSDDYDSDGDGDGDYRRGKGTGTGRGRDGKQEWIGGRGGEAKMDRRGGGEERGSAKGKA